MTKVNYPRSSPYHNTKQTSWAIGRYSHRRVDPRADDEPFTILARHQFRPECLSQDLYGSPAYYWVFGARNPNQIRDLIWDLREGMVIWVPSRAHIDELYG